MKAILEEYQRLLCMRLFCRRVFHRLLHRRSENMTTTMLQDTRVCVT